MNAKLCFVVLIYFSPLLMGADCFFSNLFSRGSLGAAVAEPDPKEETNKALATLTNLTENTKTKLIQIHTETKSNITQMVTNVESNAKAIHDGIQEFSKQAYAIINKGMGSNTMNELKELADKTAKKLSETGGEITAELEGLVERVNSAGNEFQKEIETFQNTAQDKFVEGVGNVSSSLNGFNVVKTMLGFGK